MPSWYLPQWLLNGRRGFNGWLEGWQKQPSLYSWGYPDYPVQLNFVEGQLFFKIKLIVNHKSKCGFAEYDFQICRSHSVLLLQHLLTNWLKVRRWLSSYKRHHGGNDDDFFTNLWLFLLLATPELHSADALQHECKISQISNGPSYLNV